MQGSKLLVILWFIVGLTTSATHARHNITAALVALAPVSDTDLTDEEIALTVDNDVGDAGSVLTVNWILLSTAVIVQLLLVLQRR